MKMTKSGSIVIASGCIFAIIFAVSNAWSAPEDTSSRGVEWKDGAEVYAKTCAYCHETDVGPVIRNRELPIEYIRIIVRHGSRAMPAFRLSEIDDESLVKLVDFLSQKD